MRTIFRSMMVILMLVSLTGCGAPPEPPGGSITHPYRAVTTIGQLTDMMRKITGHQAEVTGLMGPGVDPHLYLPTRGDVAALMNADIIFYCGAMLEGKMTDVLRRVARTGKPVHAVIDLLDKDLLLQPAEYEGQYDPHIWMDVEVWMEAVRAVTRTLSEYDPEHADFYDQRANAYLQELEELQDYVRRVLNTVPEDRRVLITAHDAFNYFGRAYGFEVRGIQGITTDSEAGLRDINDLVDLIVERRIGAVFIESSVADKNVRALIEGARSRGQYVRIGGTLFSDAMGSRGTYEGTYIGMMDHNVTAIVRALGGEAHARGMQGKLRLIER